jgi:alkylation response protein AidB-like acyl-CoA dehydrogenase
VFAKLAALGVCGLTIDEEYGGQGRDLVRRGRAIEELCRGGAFAAGPFIHCAFYGGINISENGIGGAEEARLLPKLAQGELLFAVRLSPEPDVGGDLASVDHARARSDDGRELILSAPSAGAPGADWADYIYCLVRSDDEAPRYRNLSFVLVPSDRRACACTRSSHANLRYTLSCDVIFEDARVPIENLVGGEAGWNRGWGMLAGKALDVEKLEITACAFGIAQAAVEEAWAYAQERRQFGQPISAHQAVRHTLVEARTKLEACAGCSTARVARAAGPAVLGRDVDGEALRRRHRGRDRARVPARDGRLRALRGPRHGAPRARPARHADRGRLVEHAEEQHREPARAARRGRAVSDCRVDTVRLRAR